MEAKLTKHSLGRRQELPDHKQDYREDSFRHVYYYFDEMDDAELQKEQLKRIMKALAVLKRQKVLPEGIADTFLKTYASAYLESLLADKMKVFNRSFSSYFHRVFLNNDLINK
jgi:hypothetical protein